MQRTLVNLIIDLTAAVLIMAMLATGYLLRFPLPPGTNKTLSLWGLSRHQWGEIHYWISLGLLTVLAVHLVLHWQWLVTVIRQRLHLDKGETNHAGWITGLLIIGLFGVFAWAAHVGVQERSDPCCDDTKKTQAKSPEGNPSANTPEPKTNLPTLVFWKDVYPTLERSCLSCHGPKKAKGNFRVDRKEDFLVLREGKAWVIPGDTDQSLLLRIVTGERTDIAVPDRHKLPASDVAIVKSWIATGANFER
jgi:hypothetical protein